MLSQTLPPAAREYLSLQRRESAAALSAVKRLWRQMGPDFDASYLRIESQLLSVVVTAQGRMATGAQEYVPAVLEDTGQARAVQAAGRTAVAPLLGVDGSGRAVDSLLYGAVTDAKSWVGVGVSPPVALARSSRWLSTTVSTTLSDTARQSEALGIGVRPVSGYVRMVVPPSCARCIILAGKHVASSVAFQRHPGCDCRHMPASAGIAAQHTLNARDYFESLTSTQQEATFGKAGAQAIRAGADPGQVVNARRGMQASQVGGRQVMTTTEGTTRRGQAYRRIGTEHGAARDVRQAGQRYSRSPVLRLMPETIAQVATDKDDYLRLLYTYGYLV